MTAGQSSNGGPPGVILDAGLQPERTSLAWRRTVLALGVGAVVSLRVLPPVLGAWGLALGIAGTMATLVVAAAAARRSARVASTLHAAGAVPPGGALLAAVAVLAALGGAAGLAAVLALGLSGA